MMINQNEYMVCRMGMFKHTKSMLEDDAVLAGKISVLREHPGAVFDDDINTTAQLRTLTAYVPDADCVECKQTLCSGKERVCQN